MVSKANDTKLTSFEVIEPAIALNAFIFNSPHSGNIYPKHFLESSRLDETAIRRSEDLFVTDLFDRMPGLGSPLFYATFPRAYLDVNREPYELDPKMFQGALPSYANVKSIRVAGGLGTIARVVSEAQEIYRHKLPVEEALLRIETLYKPYHTALRKLLARTHAKHGSAYLIDCHSMPSGGGHGNCERADFILGDRYATSCSTALTNILSELLAGKGYSVARNKPYAGGFITEHYGRPSRGLHALQIEINRGLYANEETFTKNRNFIMIKNDLTAIFDEIFEEFHSAIPLPSAAE